MKLKKGNYQKIRELNKAKGNSKKKDTLSISGEFEPKKDKTNVQKNKKKNKKLKLNIK